MNCPDPTEASQALVRFLRSHSKSVCLSFLSAFFHYGSRHSRTLIATEAILHLNNIGHVGALLVSDVFISLNIPQP